MCVGTDIRNVLSPDDTLSSVPSSHPRFASDIANETPNGPLISSFFEIAPPGTSDSSQNQKSKRTGRSTTHSATRGYCEPAASIYPRLGSVLQLRLMPLETERTLQDLLSTCFGLLLDLLYTTCPEHANVTRAPRSQPAVCAISSRSPRASPTYRRIRAYRNRRAWRVLRLFWAPEFRRD